MIKEEKTKLGLILYCNENTCLLKGNPRKMTRTEFVKGIKIGKVTKSIVLICI